MFILVVAAFVFDMLLFFSLEQSIGPNFDKIRLGKLHLKKIDFKS